MAEPERIRQLNHKAVHPARKYVLYWMQAAQRARHNHALEYAIQAANNLAKPLLVVFGLTDKYPMASERHYAFMLEGLEDAQRQLRNRGIQLVVRYESPELTAVKFAEEACQVVTDMGYTNIQRQWRLYVAENASCKVTQVETEVVVPVEVVSDKEEYAARTIRPKIHRYLDRFLVSLELVAPRHPSVDQKLGPQDKLLDLSNLDGVIGTIAVDRAVASVDMYVGGNNNAQKWLKDFLAKGINKYSVERSDPALDGGSHMSPYLHFGQISPIDIVLQVKAAKAKNADKFIEELVVRRELSMNFCHFNHNYDKYEGAIPKWARDSLEFHRPDKRYKLYSLEELEEGRTGDIYWNAAQLQMVHTGYMHNTMRMYWGKKFIEWMADPAEAWRTCQMLNDKYNIDGRDPNSCAGVAWVWGKHDRPWGPERAIFGLIRYMNAAGLKRKYSMDAYVSKIARLVKKGVPGEIDLSTVPRKGSTKKFDADGEAVAEEAAEEGAEEEIEAEEEEGSKKRKGKKGGKKGGAEKDKKDAKEDKKNGKDKKGKKDKADKMEDEAEAEAEAAEEKAGKMAAKEEEADEVEVIDLEDEEEDGKHKQTKAKVKKRKRDDANDDDDGAPRRKKAKSAKSAADKKGKADTKQKAGTMDGWLKGKK